MKILICDDQAIVRDGLKMMLSLEADFEVVGVAEDGAAAVEQVAELSPDLVLMDLKMPLMNGIEATRQIVQQHPGLPILVLTTYAADEWVFDAIRAGASGYLLKDTPREGLIEAVRGTAAGKSYIDPNVAGKLLNHVSGDVTAPDSGLTDDLSERELDVLKLIAHGLSNTDIAANLHLSEGTVRNYVSAIFTKLNVSDRTQAAVIALKHGLGG
ncbi:MAG: response regulator transcription factor [Chloroflexota bacterium]